MGALSVSRRADNGLISGTSLGALATTRGYNGFGELDSLSAAWNDSSLFQTHYTRDDLGRITGLVESVQGAQGTTTTFGYDSAGRLITVERDGQVVEAYEYDENGNRLRATYPSGTLVGSYDAQDRLVSYGSATYAYTAAGELREKVVGADTTRYTYDQLGNLTRVELPDGTGVEYVIDGRSRRVGKKVGGVLVQGFLYAGQLSPVVELDSTGAVAARYVYGTRGNVPDYMVRGGSTYRLVSDHLGSVRLVVEVASGAVVQRMDYDAFGRVVLDTNPGFQPFGYAGGLYDRHTGLVRFGARDYDVSTGRWTAKDPIGFAGGDPNLYGYVLGDPVNLVDSDGLCAESPVQQLLNWAAQNGHFGLLNLVAGIDAGVYALTVMLTGAGDCGGGVSCGGFGAIGPALFTRFGTGAESATRLASQAAAAEAKMGIHGVSVMQGAGLRTPGAVATGEALEQAGFGLVKTGANPRHYTAVLPKPVTQAVADAWNRVWGWTR